MLQITVDFDHDFRLHFSVQSSEHGIEQPQTLRCTAGAGGSGGGGGSVVGQPRDGGEEGVVRVLARAPKEGDFERLLADVHRRIERVLHLRKGMQGGMSGAGARRRCRVAARRRTDSNPGSSSLAQPRRSFM